MQFPDDTDLAEALASPQVRINPLLEFDWLRDGSYSTPVGVADYSDLSNLLKTVEDETSTVVGDIPDQVNTVVGSSSGQMTLTLTGRRNAEEYTALQLFSKYFIADNPLAGYRKEGTPVRYSRVVMTAYGPRVVRQFTGWISEMPALNEETGEVTIICSDVYDLDGTPITLPRWAIGPSADQNTPPVSGLFARMQPIQTEWAVQYLLTAGGRSLGPTPPSDAIAFWSLRGSLIPSVGTFGDYAIQAHWISQEQAFGPWVDGVNGSIAPALATGTNNGNTTQSVARAVQHNTVPKNGVSTDPDKWTEISFWGYSDGSTTSIDNATVMRLYLDNTSVQTPDDRGRVRVEHYRGGWTRLFVYETDSLGRFWGWHHDVVLDEGWHYYSWIVYWQWNSITATLTVDDGAQTFTMTTGQVGSSYGYRYAAPLIPEEIGNQIAVTCRSTLNDVMFRHSKSEISYDPGQKEPRRRDGFVMTVSDHPLSQLTYLPSRVNQSVWTLLKEIASAEMGALLLNEYGVLSFLRRESVWNVENIDLNTATELDRDKLSGLTMNESTNLYRNAISIQTSFTQAIRAITWQNSDAKHFYAPDSAPYEETITLDDSVISITPGFNVIDADSQSSIPNGAPVDRVSVAAVKADDVNTQAGFGWAANTVPLPDQTQFKVQWSAQSTPPLYIGAFKGANQAAYFVGGTRLDDVKHGKFLYQDTTEIDLVGSTSVLEIPVNEWMQSEDASKQLSNSLLRDLTQPAPVLSPVTVPADPRRQLLDIYRVRGGPMFGASQIFVQLIGMTRRDDVDDGQASDTLILRVLKTPSQALWDVAGVGFDVGTWDA